MQQPQEVIHNLAFYLAKKFQPDMHTTRDSALLLFLLPACIETFSFTRQLVPRLKLDLSRLANEHELFTYFLSVSALYVHSPIDIDGDQIANAVKLLIENEASAGGPYIDRHGLTEDTNYIINTFLSLLEIAELPSTTKQHALIPHHHISEAVTYFLSHILKPNGSCKKILDSTWSLEKVLHYISCGDLANLSETDLCTLTENITHKLQKSTSRFTSLLFCVAGSKLLMTVQNKKASLDSPQSHVSQTIYSQLTNDFSEFGLNVQKQLSEEIKKVQSHDRSHEIALLAYLLELQVEGSIDTTYVITLGKANVCLWAAYTIYDDFLDNEGIPLLLPSAHIFMRRSYDLFCHCLNNASDSALVDQQFTKMDEANLWEIKHCRATVTGKAIILTSLPDYSDLQILAERACVHVLGPVFVYQRSKKYTKESENNLKSSLNLYLIAKQIGDDIHDWQDDFFHGHLSWVVTFLLKKIDIMSGTYNLNSVFLKMKHYFWRSGCIEILKIQEDYIKNSKQLLLAVEGLDANSGYAELIEKLHYSNQQSVFTYRSQHKFLKTLRL